MDWLHLIADTNGPGGALHVALHAALVLALGGVVGWASTLCGAGAGLALPLLSAAGLPLPAALLSVKLPVALADLAACVGACRGRAGVVDDKRRSPAVWCAAAAGALAAYGVLMLPTATLLAVAVVLAVLAWLLRWRSARRGQPPAWVAAVWGGYVGLCGIGAGLLWHSAGAAGRVRSVPLAAATAAPLAPDVDARSMCGGLAWRAAANGGALLVLLLAGQQATSWVCLLAAEQAAGAFVATRWPLRRAARRQPPPAGRFGTA